MKISPNDRFGRLIVQHRDNHEGTPKHPKWVCLCDCGTYKSISRDALRSGGTSSCGCLRSEVTRKRVRTHGKRNTPEFGVWSGMKNRCYNPKNKYYKDYGGRGISVCERWKIFVNFLEDMGERPSTLHRIEREDNDGNYEPSNCTWATDITQANNRRSNTRFEFKGKMLTARELMEFLVHPISYGTLRSRLQEKGWTAYQAISTPLHGRI